MCGITGKIQYVGEITVDETQTSISKIASRGPDGKGVALIDNICLGHRRLSIIDPSVVANQPMYDSSGKYCIVFNGEIFNFKTLKQQYLSNLEIVFNTNSDTEVLLYLLIHFGPKCLEWLDGFFAFAFYDQHSKSLLLARDRFGKKPLLYYQDDRFFAFASEMKALLAYPINKEINPKSLEHYLRFTYIPQTESIFKFVKKLQPGQYLVANKHSIQVNSYFTLSIQREKYESLNYDNAKAQFLHLMEGAVQKRLLSDVPLGSFLSGGIDSSAVVALASRDIPHLNTFSIGYKDNPYYDETYYANLVSKKFNTEHTVFSISNKNYVDAIPHILDYIDEPYADASSIPLFILCQFTQNAGITVSLTGDGGDELFAGYNKHYAEYALRNPTLQSKLISNLHPLWELAPKGRNSWMLNKFRQLHKFSTNAKFSNKDRYFSLASFNQKPLDLLSDNFKKTLTSDSESTFKDSVTQLIQTNDLNEFLLTDFNFVLYNDMLVKVDLMSMANSIELRSPFLDKDVVDFAFSIPPAYKIGKDLKKKIVQDAFKTILPAELYNRPKRGFEVPLNGLFQNEFKSSIEELLLNRDFIESQGIFNFNSLNTLCKKMFSNTPEESYITIWSLIVFQNWYRNYYLD